MHRKVGHLNLSLKHRSEDSRLGSWLTAQAQTNNLKDKGQKIKTQFFFVLINKNKRREVIAIRVWVRHGKSIQNTTSIRLG
jgi:hypothetical protein